MAAKYEVHSSDLLKTRLTIEQKAHLVEVAKSVQKELAETFSPKVATKRPSININRSYCDPGYTLRSSTSIQSLLNI